MKRMLFISLVLTFVMLSGCAAEADLINYSELQINKETIDMIAKEGKEIVGSVEEYSYLSEKGKITGTYYLNNKDALVFVSKGKPNMNDQTKYEIYIDESSTQPLLLKVKTISRDKYIEAYLGEGHIFEMQNQEYKKTILNFNGVFDINDSINKSSQDTIGCFYDTAFVGGHIIKKADNGIYRETFYANEEAHLITGYCARLQYYSGRIYYVEGKKLFSINPDGTDNKLVTDNDVTDYLINDQGIFILSVYPDNIKVKFQEHGTSSYKEEFSAKGYYGDYRYSLIGIEGNTVYLSRRDVTKSWIEILAQCGDDLKVLNHKDISITYDFKPIISGDNIFYIVRGGIYKYNITENTDLLIAKILYTFGPIHSAGTP